MILKKCLNAWMSCIRKDGLCIIEHTSSHETSNSTDPFGAKISKMPFLILSWGNGKFFLLKFSMLLKVIVIEITPHSSLLKKNNGKRK